jgi:hypothetical protein
LLTVSLNRQTTIRLLPAHMFMPTNKGRVNECGGPISKHSKEYVRLPVYTQSESKLIGLG